ncbi:MAG: succinate dehydrogenase, hydrophobic membrane anchor protein [Thiothrix sp.]|nr:succinate dehydrogenase, hydrophobic membrane anchor protein [Thiothrix sp.]HPQ96874.1 succinate dehydrogenase, hydrophobic membrane anchor protein [Thiolinea sp.]
MSLITPLKKAIGLGSARDGVEHWWMQRLTAIALVPLTLWLAFGVAALAGESYEAARAWFATPFNLSMASLFIFCAFYHGALGMQVVIEDYIHHEGLKFGAMIGMKFFMALTGITCIFAILRAAFGS